MKTIVRNPSPSCIANQKANQPWDTFSGTACYVTVSDSLRDEQYHICCYCEEKLSNGNNHVEHMEPRSAKPQRKYDTYDYANLAASCNGGTVEHCGHFKDNKHKNPGYSWDPTKFSTPHSPNTHTLFEYLQNGRVIPASGSNQGCAEYMIGYLGLNSARLEERRKAHATQILETLRSSPSKKDYAFLKNYYLQPGPGGKLERFYSLSKALLK